ncbi:MAG: Fis family transcriptional regulator, partial [bacterium]|nr:Fis family transcriptional regulator [bacterium]
DIPLLIERFIARMNRLQGKAVTGVDHEVLQILMTHNFPGNIRELENIIEHAFVLCPDGVIHPHHLPGSLNASPRISVKPDTLDNAIKSTEARTIIDALKRNSYNRLAAARELGMHKSTLFRKIKKLGIMLPKIDGRSKD